MESNIGYLLSDSSRLLRRAFDERVRGLGLTAVQARLLLSLQKFPDNNQAFYAERLEIEPITLTRIVDRMEDAGWIARVADPSDRRARLLHLTDKSRGIVGRLRTRVEELVEDMSQGLSTGERAELMRLLAIVAENLAADRTDAREAANG
ncbi:MAG: MarR family transcriptional regulator [Altererythrobacter sp.]|nr:MarR family transcriptional regulator [Altererythrobacter sp.]